jgi:hypothetical protein
VVVLSLLISISVDPVLLSINQAEEVIVLAGFLIPINVNDILFGEAMSELNPCERITILPEEEQVRDALNTAEVHEIDENVRSVGTVMKRVEPIG